MTGVVSLYLIVNVVEHHHSCHEVDNLTGGQEIQIVARVFASIAVHPLQLESLWWWTQSILYGVGGQQLGWNVQLHCTPRQLESDHSIHWVVQEIFQVTRDNKC